MFLAGLSLPPAKLVPSQTGLDAIYKNATKPCAWVRNPQFWSYMPILGFWARVTPHPTSSAIFNSGVQWALNLRSAWKHGIMRMISIFQKISKSGAWRRALTDSPSTHPRDSIAIPASLMRGEYWVRSCSIRVQLQDPVARGTHCGMVARIRSEVGGESNQEIVSFCSCVRCEAACADEAMMFLSLGFPTTNSGPWAVGVGVPFVCVKANVRQMG